MTLAHSFDVFGWFTQNVENYQKVGDVLLGDDLSDTPLNRPITIDALDNCLLGEDERKAYAGAFKQVIEVLGTPETISGFEKPLNDWYWTMRKLQAREAWLEHEDWIINSKPDLGTGVKDRFEFGLEISDDEYADITIMRDAMRKELAAILGRDGFLIMPTVPSAAPLRDAPHESLQEFREKALELLCVSGLTGFPQITLPLVTVYGAPLGISLLGPAGSDQRLIGLAKQIMGG